MAGCACLVVLPYAVAIGINTSRVGIRAETAVSCPRSRCRGRAEGPGGSRGESGRAGRLRAEGVEPLPGRAVAVPLVSCRWIPGKGAGVAPCPRVRVGRCVIAGGRAPSSEVHCSTAGGRGDILPRTAWLPRLSNQQLLSICDYPGRRGRRPRLSRPPTDPKPFGGGRGSTSFRA